MSSKYRQTWWIVCRYFGKREGWRRKVIEKLCGFFAGHELSKTEWGYGGGNFVDRHCRWCDKIMKEHKLETKVPDELSEDDSLTNLGFYDREEK